MAQCRTLGDYSSCDNTIRTSLSLFGTIFPFIIIIIIRKIFLTGITP